MKEIIFQCVLISQFMDLTLADWFTQGLQKIFCYQVLLKLVFFLRFTELDKGNSTVARKCSTIESVAEFMDSGIIATKLNDCLTLPNLAFAQFLILNLHLFLVWSSRHTLLPAATKLWPRLCFNTCLWFCPQGGFSRQGEPPQLGEPPLAGRTPPRTRQTPPGWETPPAGRTPPGTR